MQTIPNNCYLIQHKGNYCIFLDATNMKWGDISAATKFSLTEGSSTEKISEASCGVMIEAFCPYL